MYIYTNQFYCQDLLNFTKINFNYTRKATKRSNVLYTLYNIALTGFRTDKHRNDSDKDFG